MDGNVVPASDSGDTSVSSYRDEAQLFVHNAPFPHPHPLSLCFWDVVERVCARNEGLDAERYLKVLNAQTEPRLDTRFL